MQNPVELHNEHFTETTFCPLQFVHVPGSTKELVHEDTIYKIVMSMIDESFTNCL